MSGETWSRDRAAEYLGIKPDSVQRVLKRAGYEAVAREPGQRGRSLYRAEDVRTYGDTRQEWTGSRPTHERKAQ